jgi:nucleoside-diphosphate-sugar epimerase
MRVLITGGGGFIGSHLVDSQLAQGHQVRTIDLHAERLAHTLSHPLLEVVVGDITDNSLLARLVHGVEVVYHLASAHLDISLSDEHYRRVNVEATLALLQRAHAAGVERVVHCSSSGVLGEIKHLPADETTPCAPTNVYERTKLEGERAALRFSQESGLPVMVIRPAWVYGPRCPRTQRLFRTIKKGHFVMIGRGQTLRHPLYISDAVKGLELAAQTDVSGEVYFIAGEKAVSIATLVQRIARLQGVRVPPLYLPTPIGKAAGYAVQLSFRPLKRPPPFSRRSVDFFLKDNAYDISKARRELGFVPDVDLESGLQGFLNWAEAAQS